MKFKTALFSLFATSFLTSNAFAVVNSNFSFGSLIITTSDSDAVIVTAENGNVKINGMDPATGVLATPELRFLSITGDDGPNVIDLSGMAVEDYSNSSLFVSISSGGGDDTISATFRQDNIEPGPGNDTILSFGASSDKYIWKTGDGNEIIDKGSEPDGFRFEFEADNSGSNISMISNELNQVVLTDHLTSETVTIIDGNDATVKGGFGDDHAQIEINNNSGISRTTMFLSRGSNTIKAKDSGTAITVSVSETDVTNNFEFPEIGGNSFNFNPANSGLPITYIMEGTGPQELTVTHADPNTTATTVFTGGNNIRFAATDSDDIFELYNIGDSTLDSVIMTTRQGNDLITTQFFDGIEQTVSGTGTNSFDKIIVDAEGLAVEETSDRLRPLADDKEVINLIAVDEVIILNQGVAVDGLWVVE